MILTSKHALLSLSQEFAELCKPLEPFHITHITYLRQYRNGSRISLSNRPRWLEDYYNLNLFDSSLFEEQPAQYHSEFAVWLGEYNLAVYRHGRQYYNTAHSITITEPVADGCEFFLFSSPPKHARAIQYLANNMEILYHFILYVKDRGKKLFHSAGKNRLWLVKNNQADTNKQVILTDAGYQQSMQQLKKQFFANTPIYRYVFEKGKHQGVHLTQRELQCLAFLLQNKTAEETAKLMHVSRRTIEFYLNNIRLKLDYDDKTELLEYVKTNRFLAAVG